MRCKTHLLLAIKIQKFTTYAPFLPLFRLKNHAKTDQHRCQPAKSVRAENFKFFHYNRKKPQPFGRGD